MAEQLVIVKLNAAQIALVGATSAAEFPAKLEAYATAAKQIENSMATQPDFAALEKRIETLETAVKGIPTEASVGVLVGATVANAVPAAMTAWAGSDAGKKLIGAEASRITMEAFAGTGTHPAKPSPAPATANQDDQRIALEKAGKFEDAYALLPANQQAEFFGAKSYAAFKKAQLRGNTKLLVKSSELTN